MHRQDPRHHPSEALLADYACGATLEGEALLIATHLAHCPLCREDTRLYETVGGALLNSIDPVPVRTGMLDDVLGAIARPGQPPQTEGTRSIADYEGENLDDLAWRRLPGGVSTYTLACTEAGCRVRLLRIPAGQQLAKHSHTGDEWMQILRGSFTDDGELYRLGDFVQVPNGSSHSPLTADGCICLILTRAPSRFAHPLIRLLAPILGL